MRLKTKLKVLVASTVAAASRTASKLRPFSNRGDKLRRALLRAADSIESNSVRYNWADGSSCAVGHLRRELGVRSLSKHWSSAPRADLLDMERAGMPAAEIRLLEIAARPPIPKGHRMSAIECLNICTNPEARSLATSALRAAADRIERGTLRAGDLRTEMVEFANGDVRCLVHDSELEPLGLISDVDAR